MADIEKIDAYNSIRVYLSERDQKDLAAKLNIDTSNLNHRLWGLIQEDEFALILYFSEKCNHILGFDEGFSFLTKSFSPDLYVEMNSGKKFFIEVKSVSEENKFRISMGNLKKRIKFANDFGCELYFAVKICGYWGLYNSTFLISNSGKINHPIDLNNSFLEELFGFKTYIFKEGFVARSIYSKTRKGDSAIRHQDFGHLVFYKLDFLGKTIIDSSQGSNSEISIVFESLHDRMSMQSQKVKNLSGDKTEVIEELINPTNISEYALLMAPVAHTINKLGLCHNSTSFFKDLLENRRDIFPIQKFREQIDEINRATNNEAILIPKKLKYKQDMTFEIDIKPNYVLGTLSQEKRVS